MFLSNISRKSRKQYEQKAGQISEAKDQNTGQRAPIMANDCT